MTLEELKMEPIKKLDIKDLRSGYNDYGIPEYGFKENMETLIDKINELTDAVNKMMQEIKK